MNVNLKLLSAELLSLQDKIRLIEKFKKLLYNINIKKGMIKMIIDTEKLKVHLQYCSYRLREHIPTEFNSLFEDEGTFNIIIVDSHHTKHEIPHIYAKNANDAIQIAMQIIRKHLPAIKIEEVYERL